MERFDNNMAAFVEWSQSLHSEVHLDNKRSTVESFNSRVTHFRINKNGSGY